MKTVYLNFLLTLFFSTYSYAQVAISGTVTDTNGNALPGANVFLMGTYDGATSDTLGNFSFETQEVGEQVLIIRFISYEVQERQIKIGNENIQIAISLKEEINRLDGVTITAGTFGASDAKKAVGLSPLEIVTTASAMGDIAKALQTMPGTQQVAEDGRLFVRGGTGEETGVFIDGLYVQNPYNASLQSIPTRSRFSPFMFKGTLFSTGGYSAEYGQAMSSVLSLQTKDLATETQTDISIMSLGADVEHTQAGKKQSLAAKVGYANLAPYMALVKQNVDWHDEPETGEASIAYRKKDRHDGLWKIYGNYQFQNLAMSQPGFSPSDAKERISLSNHNAFLQTHYRRPIGKTSVLEGGLSYTNDLQELQRDQQEVDINQNSWHVKAKIVTDLSKRIALNTGGEMLLQNYKSILTEISRGNDKKSIRDYLMATYAEGDVFFSNRLVARLGGRFEYSTLLRKASVSPRVSIAYETGKSSQLSFAYGNFFQKPQNNYLEVSSTLDFEHSTHYILNYQYETAGNFFRVEGYFKDYHELIRYEQEPNGYSFTKLDNNGYGYAKGLELFWRSKTTIKNGDFWISYSFLDTKRLFRDYPESAVPSFASTHNASFVYKHFFAKLKSQIGASWSVASGRPYNDPNQENFNQENTPMYENLSLNWAYLYRQNIIFYAAVQNVLGTENISGYRFASAPDGKGFFASRPIVQEAKRFFFFGLFITLTKNSNNNQLDRL